MKSFLTINIYANSLKVSAKRKINIQLTESRCPQKVMKEPKNQAKEQKHTFRLQIQVTFEII